MRIESVKRWHWIMFSIAVGLIVPRARQVGADRVLAEEGVIVTDQRWFERSVLRRIILADGRTVRAFDDLTVYPAYVDAGQGERRRVHLVSGRYLAGTQADTASGLTRGNFRRYCYVAPIPYPLDGQKSGNDITVLHWLAGLREQGIVYSYAWWRDPRYSTASWLGCSVIAIGIVWPTLVNLLVWRRWRRPPTEAGIDLRGVKAMAAHPAGAEPDEVAVLGAQLDARLEAAKDAEPAGAEHSDAEGLQTRTLLPLHGSPVSAPVPSEARCTKQFRAADHDYYPTELKAERRGPHDAPLP